MFFGFAEWALIISHNPGQRLEMILQNPAIFNRKKVHLQL